MLHNDLAQIEQQALGYAAKLDPPDNPAVCPLCLARFLTELWADSKKPLRHLRYSCHPLFNALMRVLSSPHVFERRHALSRALVRNQHQCRTCCPVPVPRAVFLQRLKKVAREDDIYDSALDLYVSGCGTAIYNALHSARTSFGNERGVWPSAPEHIFPTGPETTMYTLVVWFLTPCVRWDRVGMSFVAIMFAHRPLAFAALVAGSNRTRILELSISALDECIRQCKAALATASDTFTATGIFSRPFDAVRPVLEKYGGALQVLSCVRSGTGGKATEFEQFVKGYERPLYDRVLGVLELTPGEHYLDLAGVATFLAHLLSIPEQEKPNFLIAAADRAYLPLLDPFFALYQDLHDAHDDWRCRGPGCTRISHDTTSGQRFARCARCKLSQYCSRECQRRDWKRDGIPHKEVCPILQQVFAAANLRMEPEEFSDACRSHGISVSQAERLGEWAAETGFMENAGAEMPDVPILDDAATLVGSEDAMQPN
ncbi:hypothetical protein AURDEDRAFT_186289 [Auricularia subglabra TFB-10046 SS5]|nr:hypothetical protein AURDEDRAFT_186289 [Auricularia subglabra TFB-10046 SS5]